MLLIKLSPPKKYIEVLIPGISECDLIWQQGLYTGNQFKVRLSGWVLIQYHWCPYKEGTWTQREDKTLKKGDVMTHKENATWRWKIEVTHPQTKEYLKVWESRRNLDRQKEHGSDMLIISSFWPPEWWDNKFLCFKSCSWLYFINATLGN